MDPITIVGLVSAIVQFVDFGAKIVIRLDEYKKDVHKVPKEFRSISNRLPLLISTIKQTKSQAVAGRIDEERAQALNRVVEACLASTRELEDILEKVLPSGSDSLWARQKKAINSLSLASNIRDIETELSSYINTLTYHHASAGPSVGQLLQKTGSRLDGRREPCFMLKAAREEKFIGRENIIEEIDERFMKKQSRVAITGIGGVGKTQIAVEYCYRCRQNHPETSIFWVHASNHARFMAAYQEIARELAIPGIDNAEVDTLQLVLQWFNDKSNGPWLLILDNADDIETFFNSGSEATAEQQTQCLTPLVTYLPQCLNGSIIITTKDKRIGERLTNFEKPIFVQPFGLRDAKNLLQQNLMENNTNDEQCETLVETLGFFPMAITQAARFIRENSMTVVDYLQCLQANDRDAKDLLAEGYYDRGRDVESQRSVFQTWKISFDIIRQQQPRAAEILSLMAMLDRQAVQGDLLRIEGERDIEFRKAVGTLKAFSLITEEVGRAIFGMHRLVQLATQRWLELENLIQKWQENAFNAVFKCCPDSDRFHDWARWESYSPHIHIVLGYAPKTDHHRIARASLLHGSAMYNMHHGRSVAAIEKIREGCLICEELLEDVHPLRRKCTHLLADLLQTQGQFIVAEAMHRQVLEETEKALGPNDEQSITCLLSLAGVLVQQGKIGDFEEIAYTALKRSEKALGPAHVQTLLALGAVADLLQIQGKWTEAKEMNERAFEGNKKIFGDEHPFTLGSLSRIASVLEQLGDYEAAETMKKKVVDIHVKVRGIRNHDTVKSIYALAVVSVHLGKYEAAKSLNQEALNGYETIFGANHPSTLECVRNLASILTIEGNYERAEVLYRQVQDGLEKTFGPRHASSYRSKIDLAFALQKQGKFEATEGLRRQVLATFEEIFGPNHIATLSAVRDLATVLGLQDKHELAEPMIRRAYDGFKDTLGNEDPLTLNARRDLAWMLGRQGKYDVAEDLLRQVLSDLEEISGSEHFDTIQSVNALADILYSREQYEAAFSLYQRAYLGYQKIYGTSNSYSQLCLNQMDEVEKWRLHRASSSNRYRSRMLYAIKSTPKIRLHRK